jgi:glucuronate isomerase
MPFIHEDFLLQTPQASRLYHEFAENCPIIDYHCHLPPADIATNKSWENIAQVWLGGDHYKWRAMRSNGISEKFCTGSATDREKFQKWAETMPYLLRNPLFHWTQLELKKYFGIEDILTPSNAEDIWNRCNAVINSPKGHARSFMEQSQVKVVCTTDDPIDQLEHHQAIAKENYTIQVRPTWRPDKAMAVENGPAYKAYIDQLSAVSGVTIKTYDDLLIALQKRHDAFHAAGCRLSDHGLNTLYAEDYSAQELANIFKKALSGSVLSIHEVAQFKSAMLYEGAKMDHSKGWVQQFHLGALRNNNERLLKQCGPDTGFDSIGDESVAQSMSKFFNSLDKKDQLSKTIIYNLNPRDNDLYATMIGNFQDGSVPGKMQWGSGWWFLDQKKGMEDQINSLSQLGLLSRFVGMLTDSRSFLSYTRHEYFRRILCNILGQDMKEGLISSDMKWVGGMVQDICYHNAKNYFDFGL